MRGMPTRNTGPEMLVRKALHTIGLRYRLNGSDLPGRPDIIFPKQRIAVFVDGCFWHYCPHHCVLPKNNRGWWRAKLSENRRRDRRNDKALEKQGWVAIHVWEHENYDTAAERISRVVWGLR
jgi:DNA mismatch endonuclease (patch repair protein)